MILFFLGVSGGKDGARLERESKSEREAKCVACREHALDSCCFVIFFTLIGSRRHQLSEGKRKDRADLDAAAAAAQLQVAYLADCRGYVPGSKKPFKGVESERDRIDIVAFLQEKASSSKSTTTTTMK
ncbi:hypothetical protein BKA81DRAFT_311101 [Phyllosticta paracitricarpa]